MNVVFAEHGTTLRRLHRRARRAGRRRPRHGLRPDPAGRPARRRHLAARQRLLRATRDMTRTFVVGDVADDVREWHRLCKEALDRAISEIKRRRRAGSDIFDGTCDIFEAAGEPTPRTKEPGVTLVDGFFHGLGHGVGLEVHEEPGMGSTVEQAARRRRCRHRRAGPVPAGLRRRPARGHRARHRATAPRTSRTTRTTSSRSWTNGRRSTRCFLEERRYPPPGGLRGAGEREGRHLRR